MFPGRDMLWILWGLKRQVLQPLLITSSQPCGRAMITCKCEYVAPPDVYETSWHVVGIGDSPAWNRLMGQIGFWWQNWWSLNIGCSKNWRWCHGCNCNIRWASICINIWLRDRQNTERCKPRRWGRLRTSLPFPLLMLNSQRIVICSYLLPSLVRSIIAMLKLTVSVAWLFIIMTVGAKLMRIFIFDRWKWIPDLTCFTKTLTRSKGHLTTTMGDINTRKFAWGWK